MMKFKYILFIILTATISTQAFSQNYTGFNYSVGIPMADLKEYISQTSARGFGLEFHTKFNDNVALGFNVGVNTFYEEFASTTYTEGTVSLTGRQYRYTNSFPLMMSLHYLFAPGESIVPYGGLGIGTVYTLRDTDMGLYRSEIDAWQFSLKPEAGVIFNIQPGFGLKLAAKYYQNFETSDLGSQSFLAFDIGLLFLSGY